MRQQRSALCSAAVAAALAAAVAGATEPTVTRVPSGVIAAQMVGRVIVGPDGVCEIVGYYAFIDGIGQPFAGAAGEATAYFSVRSEPFRMRAVTNGMTVNLFAEPLSGTTVPLQVYHDPAPSRDFADPDTFSSGQLVATFNPRGGMATLDPLGGAAYGSSLDLVSSAPFTHQGETVDLGALGDTVTVDLHGESPAYGGAYLGLAFPFGGPVIAAGDHPITARGLRARLRSSNEY